MKLFFSVDELAYYGAEHDKQTQAKAGNKRDVAQEDAIGKPDEVYKAYKCGKDYREPGDVHGKFKKGYCIENNKQQKAGTGDQVAEHKYGRHRWR